MAPYFTIDKRSLQLLAVVLSSCGAYYTSQTVGKLASARSQTNTCARALVQIHLEQFWTVATNMEHMPATTLLEYHLDAEKLPVHKQPQGRLPNSLAPASSSAMGAVTSC